MKKINFKEELIGYCSSCKKPTIWGFFGWLQAAADVDPSDPVVEDYYKIFIDNDYSLQGALFADVSEESEN